MRMRLAVLRSAATLVAILALVALRPATSRAADVAAVAGDGAQAAGHGPKYDLRYKFKSGEEVRTRVIQQTSVRTTIDGTSQTAATVSESIKVWKIQNVNAQGQITFVHSVEHVNMRNEVTGREGMHYDSETDAKPPRDFEDVAKRIGVPLTVVTMDDRGKILKRDDIMKAVQGQTGQMTLPLPDHAVAVGESWTFPADVRVELQNKDSKLIRARQLFTLDSVDEGVATITVETQVLSPVHDPEVESQLLQCAAAGTMRFDIEAGRVISQKVELDRSVVGYPNEKSSMHYRTRFTEEVLNSTERTAQHPGGEASKQ